LSENGWIAIVSVAGRAGNCCYRDPRPPGRHRQAREVIASGCCRDLILHTTEIDSLANTTSRSLLSAADDGAYDIASV